MPCFLVQSAHRLPSNDNSTTTIQHYDPNSCFGRSTSAGGAVGQFVIRQICLDSHTRRFTPLGVLGEWSGRVLPLHLPSLPPLVVCSCGILLRAGVSDDTLSDTLSEPWDVAFVPPCTLLKLCSLATCLRYNWMLVHDLPCEPPLITDGGPSFCETFFERAAEVALNGNLANCAVILLGSSLCCLVSSLSAQTHHPAMRARPC